MAFLIVSFLAGVLTVLAPCVLPILPVIIGTSAASRSKTTPYVVVTALAVSIIVFTYLLKFSAALIMVPPEFWTYLSGGILFLFGLVLLFPGLWESQILAKLSTKSNILLGKGFKKKSLWGDAVVGVALGPIFSTCSPTYFVILASVLPVSFLLGSVYLLAYVIGLSAVLLLIAFLGQRFADRLEKFSDPKGYFKRIIAVIFILLGLAIAFGYEKRLETAILDSGYFDVTKIEQRLLELTEPSESEETGGEAESGQDGEVSGEVGSLGPASPTQTPTAPLGSAKSNTSAKLATKMYKEIRSPSGFVNTDGITLKSLVGKKVILLDFMTYSCINCQRTFPYLVAWYDKYRDQGLEIVGIHTPEFAFEKDIGNVKEAMNKFGIKFPVVLDNDYGTWSVYGNRFWPRKYLIDIHGNIVYDHIGEGSYEETEMKIKELLHEREAVLGEEMVAREGFVSTAVVSGDNQSRSPETYFGSARNEFLGNGRTGQSGQQTFVLPSQYYPNILYLSGTWDISSENAESVSDVRVIYHYNAKEVYIVADADTEVQVEVLQDGKPLTSSRGEDVDQSGIFRVKESRLYRVIKNTSGGEHLLEFKVRGAGVRMYAFTFG